MIVSFFIDAAAFTHFLRATATCAKKRTAALFATEPPLLSRVRRARFSPRRFAFSRRCVIFIFSLFFAMRSCHAERSCFAMPAFQRYAIAITPAAARYCAGAADAATPFTLTAGARRPAAAAVQELSFAMPFDVSWLPIPPQPFSALFSAAG